MLADRPRLDRSTAVPPPAAPALPPSTGAAFLASPAPDLSGRVDLVWSAAGGGTDRPTLHEFFPDAGVHLVVRHSPSGGRLVLLGPTTERAAVERAAGAEYIGFRFLAGQAPRLAEVRSAEITDGLVELGALGGVPVEALAERLRALPDLASRQRLMERLLRRETRPLVEDPRCRRATRLLEARRGRVRVDGLAAELGLSVRSLERLFLAAFGVRPKRMARLVRLRYVLAALHSGAFESLAELAQACGYADQPHFIHDFRSLTGRSPGAKDAARSRTLEPPGPRVVHRVRP